MEHNIELVQNNVAWLNRAVSLHLVIPSFVWKQETEA